MGLLLRPERVGTGPALLQGGQCPLVLFLVSAGLLQQPGHRLAPPLQLFDTPPQGRAFRTLSQQQLLQSVDSQREESYWKGSGSAITHIVL